MVAEDESTLDDVLFYRELPDPLWSIYQRKVMALNGLDIALDGTLAIYCWWIRPSESQAKTTDADNIKSKLVSKAARRRDGCCVAGVCGPILRLDHVLVYARRFLPHILVCLCAECRVHDTSVYFPLTHILTDQISPEDHDRLVGPVDGKFSKEIHV
jgi:hypothetical protein